MYLKTRFTTGPVNEPPLRGSTSVCGSWLAIGPAAPPCSGKAAHRTWSLRFYSCPQPQPGAPCYNTRSFALLLSMPFLGWHPEARCSRTRVQPAIVPALQPWAGWPCNNLDTATCTLCALWSLPFGITLHTFDTRDFKAPALSPSTV